MNFAIGIPTINQWPLLKGTIEKYLIQFPSTQIFIVDNGKQGIDINEELVFVIESTQPKSVAASWNQLSRLIFRQGHTHALILNDDVVLTKKQKEVDQLLSLHDNDDFIVSQTGFCSFMLPKQTFQAIGGFDENFKGAYFEDNDYERRLKLAKMSIARTSFLNPQVIEESASIKKDPSLNKNFQPNSEYYKRKWGGYRGGETFILPFDGKTELQLPAPEAGEVLAMVTRLREIRKGYTAGSKAYFANIKATDEMDKYASHLANGF